MGWHYFNNSTFRTAIDFIYRSGYSFFCANLNKLLHPGRVEKWYEVKQTLFTPEPCIWRFRRIVYVYTNLLYEPRINKFWKGLYYKEAVNCLLLFIYSKTISWIYTLKEFAFDTQTIRAHFHPKSHRRFRWYSWLYLIFISILSTGMDLPQW